MKVALGCVPTGDCGPMFSMRMLDVVLGVALMVVICVEGWFTGHQQLHISKLEEHLRRIVENRAAFAVLEHHGSPAEDPFSVSPDAFVSDGEPADLQHVTVQSWLLSEVAREYLKSIVVTETAAELKQELQRRWADPEKRLRDEMIDRLDLSVMEALVFSQLMQANQRDRNRLFAEAASGLLRPEDLRDRVHSVEQDTHGQLREILGDHRLKELVELRREKFFVNPDPESAQ